MKEISVMPVPFSLLRSALPDISPSSFHVSDKEQISQICIDHSGMHRPHGALYLCRKSNPSVPSYLPHIICEDDPACMLELYDALNRKLAEYTEWEQDLTKCISECAPLSVLLETGHRMIGNPITVYDNSMRLIGTAGIPLDKIPENWVDINGARYIKPETWIYSREVDLPVLRKEITVPELIVNGGVRMFQCPLSYSSRILGLMTIPVIDTERDESFIPIIQTFIQYTSQLMALEKIQVKQQSDRISFLNDIYTGRMKMTVELANHYINILDLQNCKQFQILVLKPAFSESPYDWKVLNSYVISSIFPRSYLLQTDDLLIVLIGNAGSEISEHQLNLFLDSAGLRAGFSMVFEDFIHLREYYLQAESTLNQKSLVSYFDGHSTDFILRYFADHNECIPFLNRKVKTLLQEDPAGALAQTLLCYLLNDRSYQIISKELGIHRSTVKYRLDKITSLIGPLTDITSDERMDILISLKLAVSEALSRNAASSS